LLLAVKSLRGNLRQQRPRVKKRRPMLLQPKFKLNGRQQWKAKPMSRLQRDSPLSQILTEALHNGVVEMVDEEEGNSFSSSSV
jgi:hypothetical protein